MSGDQQYLFDDVDRELRREEGEERRDIAQHEFRRARNYAREHGFELIRHNDAHYKVKTPTFLLEIYPGNQRVYRHSKDVPYIPMPEEWGLMDVVEGVAKVLGFHPPLKTDEPPNLEEFKQASMLAAKYGFCLFKKKGVYSIRPTMSRTKGWEIIIDLAGRTITRVNDKGPHPELNNEWTLMDVVEAIHDRFEAHGYRPPSMED